MSRKRRRQQSKDRRRQHGRLGNGDANITTIAFRIRNYVGDRACRDGICDHLKNQHKHAYNKRVAQLRTGDYTKEDAELQATAELVDLLEPLWEVQQTRQAATQLPVTAESG